MALHSHSAPGGLAVLLKYIASAFLLWLFASTPFCCLSDLSIRLSPVLLLHPCLFCAEKIMERIILCLSGRAPVKIGIPVNIRDVSKVGFGIEGLYPASELGCPW